MVGNAAPVETDAPDLVAVDADDFLAELPEPDGGVVSARPGADDDRINLMFCQPCLLFVLCWRGSRPFDSPRGSPALGVSKWTSHDVRLDGTTCCRRSTAHRSCRSTARSTRAARGDPHGHASRIDAAAPERSLAQRLEVNRSTVVHAYRELVADGLIEQRVGAGSRVVPQLRGGQPERAAGVPWWVTLPPWRVGEFPNVLGELAAKPRAVASPSCKASRPTNRRRSTSSRNRSARVARDPRFILSYGDSEGYEPLRDAIAREWGCAAPHSGGGHHRPDGLDPRHHGGRTVLGRAGRRDHRRAARYPGALQIFQICGLRAIPVPVDDEGMRVDHVEAILRTRRPRFIYTMPSLHNPTNVTMNADRRERLVTLARRPAYRSSKTIPTASSRTGDAPLVGLAPDYVVYFQYVHQDDRALAARWMARRTAHDSRAAAPAKQALDMATSLYVQAAITDYFGERIRRARGATARRAAAAPAACRRSHRRHWPCLAASQPTRPEDFICGRRRRANCARARCSTPPNGSARRFFSARRSSPTRAAIIISGSR